MEGPQDTYEAGPNGNEVLGPNPGTNILKHEIHEKNVKFMKQNMKFIKKNVKFMKKNVKFMKKTVKFMKFMKKREIHEKNREIHEKNVKFMKKTVKFMKKTVKFVKFRKKREIHEKNRENSEKKPCNSCDKGEIYENSWKKSEIQEKKWNSGKKVIHEKKVEFKEKKREIRGKQREIHAKKRTIHEILPGLALCKLRKSAAMLLSNLLFYSHPLLSTSFNDICIRISPQNSPAPYESYRTYSWTHNRVFPSVYSFVSPSFTV